MTNNRILAALIEARGLIRSGGNPNHVESGEKGGQFTSGPGGSSAKHGKHWAKRQRRRKKRLADKVKEIRTDRAEMKARHKAERQDWVKTERAERKTLRQEHHAEHKSLAKDQTKERRELDRDHAREIRREKDPDELASIHETHGLNKAEQESSHRQEVKDLWASHKEARSDQRVEHQGIRKDIKEGHKDERREFAGRTKDELREEFKSKKTDSGHSFVSIGSDGKPSIDVNRMHKTAVDLMPDRQDMLKGKVRGDPALAKVAKSKGFDGKGTVVSKGDLDQKIKEGAVEMHRGMIADDDKQLEGYIKQFKEGDIHYGLGLHGNGIYAASGPNGKKGATEYANGNEKGVVRMALMSDAKVINIADLKVISKKVADSVYESKARGDEFTTMKTLSDHGMVATMLGYDAIKSHTDYTPGEYVILNRKKLYIQE